MCRILKEGKDPGKEMEGKYHYDLRILPKGATAWFGLTFFTAPWKGRPDRKTMGSVKGYQVLHPKGQKLKEFLLKHFEATQGERIWERRDVLYWMKVKKLWAKPGERGNPTKNEMAVMLALPGDYFAPCVIHRRELDFYDITFLGKHLNGRYYYRLVQRKLNKNEMTKKQREAGKPVYGLFFYFWKAKKCFPLDLMKKIASEKKKLEPVSLKEAKKMEIEQEMD